MKQFIMYEFTRWAEYQQAELVRNVSASMRADARFNSLHPLLDELDTRYASWQQTAAEAASRDVRKVEQKNRLRRETVNQLYVIAMQVNLLCKGTDYDLALSSGLPLKAQPQPVTEIERPAIIAVNRTPYSGCVELAWTTRRGVISYAIEHSADGMATWTNGQYCKRMKTRIAGLTPGVQVAFRVKAIGSTVESDWSDPVSVLMT